MKAIVIWIGLILLALFLVMPFIWMVLVSLQPSRAPIPELVNLVPKHPAWQNYRTVVFNKEVPVFQFLSNSVFVSMSAVALQVLICSLAAYGFSRFKFKGRATLFSLFIGSMMFSGTVTQLPIYLLLRSWGWLDTYSALIVPVASSPFGVFLLKQFFDQLPREIDEAATLDGASDPVIFWRLILPMSKAPCATLATFAFISTWTDFFWPLISTSSLEKRTLEVGLSIFKNSYGATNWPLQMTAAIVTLVPVLVVFLLMQRYFVRGVTLGSIK